MSTVQTTILEALTLHAATVPLAPSTRKYRNRLRVRLADDPFGALPAAAAKPIHLLEFVNAAPGWTAGSRRLAVLSINASLNWAVGAGVIDTNPLANVRVQKGGQGRAWTEEEYARAMAAMARHQPYFRAFVRFMAATGARPGEVVSIQRTDVVPKAVVLKRHKTYEKTRKPRLIPLTAEAVACMAEIPNHDCNYVFPNRNGQRWTAKQLAERMATLRKRAELPGDCKLHGLRHLFATRFVKRGGNIAVLSKILGHASIQTTINCYVHLADDDVDMMLDAMEKLRP